jgi:hypothetical protein
LERELLAKLKRGQDPTAGVVRTKLLPYQVRGVPFAACRGRVVLADDMGLGKTVQALAAVELLRRRKGIERALVVAPASVKYQWKTEIEKFTDLPAQATAWRPPKSANGTTPRRQRRAFTAPLSAGSGRPDLPHPVADDPPEARGNVSQTNAWGVASVPSEPPSPDGAHFQGTPFHGVRRVVKTSATALGTKSHPNQAGPRDGQTWAGRWLAHGSLQGTTWITCPSSPHLPRLPPQPRP